MIDKGANPFIIDNFDQTWGAKTRHLSNRPTQKSVYFTTRPLVGNAESNDDFLDPWFYRTGVFDGKFNSVIGEGASGTVISGEWYGKKAAFKFVEIGEKMVDSHEVRDGLKILDKKLSEMTSVQATKGSKIVTFYGHYR